MNQIERQGRIVDQILAEREKQDEKWGPIGSRLHRTDEYWMTVLGEEVGECCEDIWLHQDENNLIKELIQVAAVAVAHIEAIEERRNLGVMLIPNDGMVKHFQTPVRLGGIFGNVCREKLESEGDE